MGGWAPGGARAGAKAARFGSGAAGASRPPVRAQLSVPRPRNQGAAGQGICRRHPWRCSGWSPGAGRVGAKDAHYGSRAAGPGRPRARAWWSVPCPRNQSGAPHTCSRTEPCSCSCVRDRCSGRARQDGVKSWPLCANRKPGCRAIAARSVTTRQRGVHTLLHSAQPSESLAPCHTLA